MDSVAELDALEVHMNALQSNHKRAPAAGDSYYSRSRQATPSSTSYEPDQVHIQKQQQQQGLDLPPPAYPKLHDTNQNSFGSSRPQPDYGTPVAYSVIPTHLPREPDSTRAGATTGNKYITPHSSHILQDARPPQAPKKGRLAGEQVPRPVGSSTNDSSTVSESSCRVCRSHSGAPQRPAGQSATHDASSGSQNTGNHIGTRSTVRQTKLFRMYESGNAVKGILGQDCLQWDVSRKQGAYSGPVWHDGTRSRGGLASGDGRETYFPEKENVRNCSAGRRASPHVVVHRSHVSLSPPWATSSDM